MDIRKYKKQDGSEITMCNFDGIDCFYNRDIVKIFPGLTTRQLIHWTERGLIFSLLEVESQGAKRGYDIYSVFEAGVIKALFDAGLQIHLVRRILRDLRNHKLIEVTEYFQRYYEELLDIKIRNNNKWMKLSKEKSRSELVNELRGSDPVGLMTIFFTNENGPYKMHIFEQNLTGTMELIP